MSTSNSTVTPDSITTIRLTVGLRDEIDALGKRGEKYADILRRLVDHFKATSNA